MHFCRKSTFLCNSDIFKVSFNLLWTWKVPSLLNILDLLFFGKALKQLLAANECWINSTDTRHEKQLSSEEKKMLKNPNHILVMFLFSFVFFLLLSAEGMHIVQWAFKRACIQRLILPFLLNCLPNYIKTFRLSKEHLWAPHYETCYIGQVGICSKITFGTLPCTAQN